MLSRGAFALRGRARDAETMVEIDTGPMLVCVPASRIPPPGAPTVAAVAPNALLPV